MKKKLKIFSIVFGIILLVGASYVLYILKFKEYDVADEEVDEIIGDNYTIELPDGTIITMDEDGTIIETADQLNKEDEVNAGAENDNNETNDREDETDAGAASNGAAGDTSGNADNKGNAPNKDNAGQGSSGNTGNLGNTEPPKKATVADIKNKYTPSFQALQSQANGKLNALVGRAKSEYSTKQANGESVDYGYFFNKYSGAAEAIETQTDSVFNGVLRAVKQDLTANGYSESYAQSFVDDYNAAKKARKDNLLSKAMGQ